MFEAGLTAQTGFATVTVTGTSGSLTQTAVITLAVSAATLRTGLGSPANLSAAYNVAGIYTEGITYSRSGGMGAAGYSFSANLLGPVRVLSGMRFTLGAANQLNAVSGTGAPINLLTGQFSSLLLLGNSVDGEGPDITGDHRDIH